MKFVNIRYRTLEILYSSCQKVEHSEKKENFKKNIFFIIITNFFFITLKILKMENKHPEHFWSAFNSLSENKKIFGF